MNDMSEGPSTVFPWRQNSPVSVRVVTRLAYIRGLVDALGSYADGPAASMYEPLSEALDGLAEELGCSEVSDD